MKKAISSMALAAIAASLLFPAAVEAQFGRRIREHEFSELGQSVIGNQGSIAVGGVPMWQYGKPAAPIQKQFVESSTVNSPRLSPRATNVYSPPQGRVSAVVSNSYRGNSIIPLRSANSGLDNYRPVSIRRHEPLTNVYRPPATKNFGNFNSTYSSNPVPSPIVSEVVVAGAKDAMQLNLSEAIEGTKLRYPSTANREFVFQLDGTSYKINPGQSINLSADQKYQLRFSAGAGLGDRIATLKPNERYAFDFRGEEGWVLIPDVPSNTGARGGQ